METFEDREAWVSFRTRLLKDIEAQKAWLMDGLRAWLTSPTSEGGLGFDALRAEKAMVYFRGESKGEEKREQRAAS